MNEQRTTNRMITPLNEFFKEVWNDLIKSGYQTVPDEQLPNLIQIIGHNSAFKYSYFVDNEDTNTEDSGALCTIVSIPATIGDVVNLVIEDDEFESDLQYLKLIDIDNDNYVILSYPIPEIGNLIFERNDDEIQIYFQYRNMVITLILSQLNV